MDRRIYFCVLFVVLCGITGRVLFRYMRHGFTCVLRGQKFIDHRVVGRPR